MVGLLSDRDFTRSDIFPKSYLKLTKQRSEAATELAD